MIRKIQKYLFPDIDIDVQSDVDKKSLDDIYHICIVIFIFEALALVLFLLTRKEFDRAAMISLASVSFCLGACLFGAVCAGMMKRKEKLSHVPVAVFNSCYYLLLSFWAAHSAYRDYGQGKEMLTFFAVQILMVCFVPLIPVLGILFPCIIYTVMFTAMYRLDGGAGLNVFNCALLVIVTITGFIVQYYSQMREAQNSVDLNRSIDELEYNNRHDGLTGLRNRRALDEDVDKIVNNHVTAYMIDINYFKEINDTYGHAVGDVVLRVVSKWLKEVFSADRCYRYGGDEFLVLSTGEEAYKEDTHSFSVPEITDGKLLLSIGRMQGDPKDHDELFNLISQADVSLYEVKKRTHSPEFGGHGERKKG